MLWHTDIAIYAVCLQYVHLLETVYSQALLQNAKLLVASLQAFSHLLQKLLSIALDHECLQQLPIHYSSDCSNQCQRSVCAKSGRSCLELTSWQEVGIVLRYPNNTLL